MTRATVRARVADLGDLDRIAEIADSGWNNAYRGLITPAAIGDMLSRWYSPEVLLRRLDRGGLEVADVSGAVVGFMQHAQGSPAVHEVYAIYVDPPYLGRGAGWALWQSAVTSARVAASAAIELWVLAGNRLGIEWYDRQGGEEVGRQVIQMLDGEHIELRYRFGL
jgi:ribosomal protein S18 acetylase RimI-like enzyme